MHRGELDIQELHEKKSLDLFGARATGKSTIIQQSLRFALVAKHLILIFLIVLPIMNDIATASSNSEIIVSERSDPAPSDSSKPETNFFVQLNPFPPTLTLGGIFAKHRAGIFGSRYKSGNVGYKSLGLEYSHFPLGGKVNGIYGKLYIEHRKFDAGLEVNSKYSDEKKQWMHDTLNDHSETHFAAIAGYHTNFASSLYIDIGLGWQYNTNPADIETSGFGVGQSIKSRQEATGEVAIGYFF
jgi:hypothetical protein